MKVWELLGITAEAADRLGLHKEAYGGRIEWVRTTRTSRLVWDGNRRFGRICKSRYWPITKEEFLSWAS